jgi:hypothetical protein
MPSWRKGLKDSQGLASGSFQRTLAGAVRLLTRTASGRDRGAGAASCSPYQPGTTWMPMFFISNSEGNVEREGKRDIKEVVARGWMGRHKREGCGGGEAEKPSSPPPLQSPEVGAERVGAPWEGALQKHCPLPPATAQTAPQPPRPLQAPAEAAAAGCVSLTPGAC